jgi:hypothetical protein
MLKRVGGPTPSDGVSNSACQASASRLKKTLHWQVVGTRAYAVPSATLTIALEKGESIIRPGILIYTVIKLSGQWKAESQT